MAKYDLFSSLIEAQNLTFEKSRFENRLFALILGNQSRSHDADYLFDEIFSATLKVLILLTEAVIDMRFCRMVECIGAIGCGFIDEAPV